MKVHVTQGAMARLKELQDHWSAHVPEEQVEERTVELWDAIDWLRKHPYAGQFEDQLALWNAQYRRWVVGHVKIVYRIVGRTLYVTDLFDSRQDPRHMRG